MIAVGAQLDHGSMTRWVTGLTDVARVTGKHASQEVLFTARHYVGRIQRNTPLSKPTYQPRAWWQGSDKGPAQRTQYSPDPSWQIWVESSRAKRVQVPGRGFLRESWQPLRRALGQGYMSVSQSTRARQQRGRLTRPARMTRGAYQPGRYTEFRHSRTQQGGTIEFANWAPGIVAVDRGGAKGVRPRHISRRAMRDTLKWLERRMMRAAEQQRRAWQ